MYLAVAGCLFGLNVSICTSFLTLWLIDSNYSEDLLRKILHLVTTLVTTPAMIGKAKLREEPNMAFVRTKSVGGNKYYQLVRNYREGGGHRQEVLYHLGNHQSLETAIDAETDALNYLWGERAYWLEGSDDIWVALEREEVVVKFFNGKMPGLAAAEARHEGVKKILQEYFDLPQRQQSWEYLEELRMEDIEVAEILEYYKALEWATYYDALIVDQTKKLDKLLDLQRKYFQDRLSGSKGRQTARSRVLYG